MDPIQFEKMYYQANDIMGPFADLLLQQASFPPSSDSRLVVLDNACGSGVVSSHILSLLSPNAKARLDLTCADISEAMITNMTRRIETSGWNNVHAVIADAMDTKFASSHFSHTFFNFGPFILPDPLAGLRECHRILRSNGILGFTTWQRVPWFAEYRAGIARNTALSPFPSDAQLGKAFSETPERWDNVDDVRSHFEGCGFADVDVRIAENTTRMKGVSEVEAMLPYTLGMMISKFWTKEEVERYKRPAGEAVVEYIREKYKDGPVAWRWVSIVATGRKG